VSLVGRMHRAVKAIDQDGLADINSFRYVPLENHQTWTEMATPVERNYIAVYQCVRVLSNTFAQLPLKLYRRRPGGGKDEATDHPLYRTLHLAPNPEMTSFVWRKIAMRHLATWGNHYSEIAYDNFGRPQLWPMSPDRIEVKWGPNGRRVYIHTSAGGTRTEMRPGSVFHMQGQTTDGLSGSSPIADLRKTLSLAQAAGRFAGAVFDNGARPGTVVTHPKTLSTPAQERLIAQMEELKGSSSANKTVLLEEGMSVTTVGFPPEDAMFLETQLNQHRLIYGAYGIPPHKVGDLERATFSNIEHQALEYIQDGVMPWFVNAEQEFAVQLIPEDDVFAEFLVDGYLRGDAKSRAEALAIRLQNGTLTQDQWRALENENPLPDGTGAQTWMAVNYAPVAATLAPPEPVVEPLPPEIPSVPDILAAASKSAGDQVMRIAEGSIAAQERMGDRYASPSSTR
jgi:HK97 family phage portal protein